jgi:hypothetical protein
MQDLNLILASSVIAAAVSSFFTLYLSERNFRNDYYKAIISKRFGALEGLREIIDILKIAIPETNGSYHAIFGWNENDYIHFTNKVASGQDISFWVCDETKDALLALNKEFFRCSVLQDQDGLSLIEVGKLEYQEIGKLRDNLEIQVLKELPNVHKVHRFLRGKKVENAYLEYDLKDRPSSRDK